MVTYTQVELWHPMGMESKGIMNVTKSYFRESVGVILMYNSHETIGPLRQWIEAMDLPCTLSLWMNISDGRVSTNDGEVEDFVTAFEIEHDMCFAVSFDNMKTIQENFCKLVCKIHTTRQKLKRKQSSLMLVPEQRNGARNYCPCRQWLTWLVPVCKQISCTVQQYLNQINYVLLQQKCQNNLTY